ncbi:MAG: acetolactate synthase small subunit [Candidatus Omnitrophica bacterium]|nr:acetolactate synthase small subunit [Candidatus Omnitrophota bacterium]
MSEKYTLSCVVENHFGVLARMSGLISARGFNIDSLTVSATEDPTISRMTIVVDADATKLEQVKNQLNRLVDVIEVAQLQPGEFIDRELLLARVKADGGARAAIEAAVKRFSGRVASASDSTVVVEAVGDTSTLDQLVAALRPHGITQLVRTGRVALGKA